MPRKKPTTLEDALDVIWEQENELAELRAGASRTVGGFLDRNGKSIIAILLGVITLISGTSVVTGLVNGQKINTVEQRVDANHSRTDEVGSGVDDLKREVKRKPLFFTPEKEP